MESIKCQMVAGPMPPKVVMTLWAFLLTAKQDTVKTGNLSFRASANNRAQGTYVQ
jgi:hypothetical protein